MWTAYTMRILFSLLKYFQYFFIEIVWVLAFRWHRVLIVASFWFGIGENDNIIGGKEVDGFSPGEVYTYKEFVGINDFIHNIFEACSLI